MRFSSASRRAARASSVWELRMMKLRTEIPPNNSTSSARITTRTFKRCPPTSFSNDAMRQSPQSPQVSTGRLSHGCNDMQGEAVPCLMCCALTIFCERETANIYPTSDRMKDIKELTLRRAQHVHTTSGRHRSTGDRPQFLR